MFIPPNEHDILNNMHRGPWFELHQNFVLYILHALKLYPNPCNEIIRLSKQWAEWDVLTSLANYRFVVQILFEYLTKLPNLSPASAIDVPKRLSQDMSQVLHVIDSILSDRATYEHFLSCRGTVAQRLLDLLQDLLDSSHELRSRPSLSKALVRLSGECGIHPTCFTLEVKKVTQQVAGGGFGDIWKGLVGGQTVAVKSMRQFADDDVKASIKKLGREALIWRQLSHPNLLPFFGMYMLENRLCLISPWMDNGDLKKFLNNPPNDIDRVALIADVAQGLEYLHSNDVVHGDLKTVNILVTPSRRACISDFGLSTIVDELSLKMTFSSRSGRAGTVRYQAPELLKNESPTHFGSDIYAFACVGYEILTGKVPFFEVANEASIIFKVVIEEARPSGLELIFPDKLRLLLVDCWHQKADKRPTSSAILQRLLNHSAGEKIKRSQPSDWDGTYSARFRRSIQEWPLFPSIGEIERRILSNARIVHHTSLEVSESIRPDEISRLPTSLTEMSWPDDTEAQVTENETMKNTGNEAHKKRDLQKAESQSLKSWEWPQDITFYMGVVHFEQGEYDRAIEACNKAVQEFEGRFLRSEADSELVAKAYGLMGSSLQKKGDYASAIEYFQKSLTEHRSPDILNKLQDVQRIKAEEEMQAYDPAKSATAREKGNGQFNAGDFLSAVKSYTESIRRNPSDARGYMNRAAAYKKLEALPEALKDVDEAIKTDPTFTKAYIRKSSILFAMQDYAKAIEAAQEARDHDPEHKHTREISQKEMKCQQELLMQGTKTLERAMRNLEVAQLVNNPEIRQILQQTNPLALQDHMRNPIMRGKIQKLVNAGFSRAG
ncbi:Protein kinase domain-containing protein [Mycena sanguinolenta]|uniref:Protein kinase domain-containing protein n=1 Tax=Mycena sanguinolenta TaxID=230812 RepID=A0A8H7D158_9AGAR|nr:Protein kinase domain-containing protein [Mycena sanguinolenta]